VRAAGPLPAGVLERAALRREPGRPGEVHGVQRGGGTGFWRFETIDGLCMAVSFSADGRFTGGALLPNPACDAKSDGLDSAGPALQARSCRTSPRSATTWGP
jgi:hypothetical protein